MPNEVWLIDHKATLDDSSPLNMDGSEWILGVCVLRAENQDQAMEKLGLYLQENALGLQEVYEIVQYRPENYLDNSARSDQVNYAARRVMADGETCYVYARTSETIKAMDEDSEDE